MSDEEAPKSKKNTPVGLGNKRIYGDEPANPGVPKALRAERSGEDEIEEVGVPTYIGPIEGGACVLFGPSII